MKCFARTLGLIAFTLASTTSLAKTYKYDFVGIHSNNGFINYPGLDFNQAETVLLTVNKDPLSPQTSISTLDITFPNAAKLRATGFKKLDGSDTYRAIVNDAWIYRQVIVDIRNIDFNVPHHIRPTIEVSVSEKTDFIQPENNIKGHPLFFVDGDLRDITPSKVIDTASVVAEGKRVNLSLRENLSFALPSASINGPREGFVIDALWFGKGLKTFYIPASVPNSEFDRYSAVALELEELNGPEGKEYAVSVKFLEASGGEMQTPPQPLKPLLDAAFSTGF